MLRWTRVQFTRTVAALSCRLLLQSDGIPGDLLCDCDRCLPTERLAAVILDLVPDELSGVEQLTDVQTQHACTDPCAGRVAHA